MSNVLHTSPLDPLSFSIRARGSKVLRCRALRRKALRRKALCSLALCSLALCCTAAVTLTGCSESSSATSTPSAKQLEVQQGQFSERHLLTGELVAEEGVFLIAPNTNQWPVTIQWLVEDGTEVQAGDPVIEFDNSQLTSHLEDLSSRLVEARNELLIVRSKVSNELAQAEFSLEQQKATFGKARLAAQVPKDFSSRQEYERRQLELEKEKLALDDSELRLETQRRAGEKAVAVQAEAVAKAQRATSRLDDDLGKLRLTAPEDGLVLVARNRQGRTYQSSDTAIPGVAVASMPDLSTLMVEARLFDVDDSKLQVGQKVRVTLDAFPDEPMAGTVREISDYADQESSVSTRRAFVTRIDVDGIDAERMRPGMSVNIALDLEPYEALLIPRSAIAWTAAGKAHAVLSNGTQVPVRLGPCNPSSCVLDEGPPAGTALGHRRRAL